MLIDHQIPLWSGSNDWKDVRAKEYHCPESGHDAHESADVFLEESWRLFALQSANYRIRCKQSAQQKKRISIEGRSATNHRNILSQSLRNDWKLNWFIWFIIKTQTLTSIIVVRLTCGLKNTAIVLWEITNSNAFINRMPWMGPMSLGSRATLISDFVFFHSENATRRSSAEWIQL